MGCTPVKQNKKPVARTIERKGSIDTSVLLNNFYSITQHYNFKGLLGHGKFGRVILAESAETKQQVAIKIIPKENSSMQELMEEIRLLSSVDHPNIVKYFKHYESEKYLYVVMEYCSGGDLFQKIVDQGKFTEAEAAVVMEELLRAINHCHHLGIIHRDLKPENILYSSDGLLKIIDFGLSMKTDAMANEIAGTPDYIAPETFVDKIYTKACDIWSLGVIMHVLLSGYVPIAGETLEEISEKIMRYSGPTFTSKRWENVSQEARDLLKKMLDPDYDTRITAAEALKHPWFTSRRVNSLIDNSDVVEALRKYSKFSMLKKNVLEIIVKNVNDNDMYEFKQTFLDFDKEMTGLITSSDLEESIKSSNYDMTGKEIEDLTKMINHNGEAFINYSSFIAALIATRKFLTEDKLDSLFKVLEIEQGDCLRLENTNNANGKAKISFDEFKKLLFN